MPMPSDEELGFLENDSALEDTASDEPDEADSDSDSDQEEGGEEAPQPQTRQQRRKDRFLQERREKEALKLQLAELKGRMDSLYEARRAPEPTPRAVGPSAHDLIAEAQARRAELDKSGIELLMSIDRSTPAGQEQYRRVGTSISAARDNIAAEISKLYAEDAAAKAVARSQQATQAQIPREVSDTMTRWSRENPDLAANEKANAMWARQMDSFLLAGYDNSPETVALATDIVRRVTGIKGKPANLASKTKGFGGAGGAPTPASSGPMQKTRDSMNAAQAVYPDLEPEQAWRKFSKGR